MVEIVHNINESRGELMHGQPIIYSTSEMTAFSQAVANVSGYPLFAAVQSNFSDGEARIQLLADTRGRDVFVIGSTHQPDRNLLEQLCIVRAAKKSSAERITCVIPYFGYCRADWKDRPRACPTTRLACDLLVEAGIDRLLTIDLHAPQIMEFFDSHVCVDQLFGASHFLEVIKLDWENSAIIALDQGSHKICKRFWQVICDNLRKVKQSSQLPVLAFLNKARPDVNRTIMYGINIEEGQQLGGREILLLDDMIDTAGSVEGAVKALQEYPKNHDRETPVKSINVAATHGVLSGPAVDRLKMLPIKNLWVTDTIPSAKQKLQGAVSCYRKESLARLFAEAIVRIHEDRSISELIKI